MKKERVRVTLPQKGHRIVVNNELVKPARNLRHKHLKPFYAMVTRVPHKNTKLRAYSKLVSMDKANTLVYGRLVPNPITGVPNVVMPSRQYAFA